MEIFANPCSNERIDEVVQSIYCKIIVTTTMVALAALVWYKSNNNLLKALTTVVSGGVIYGIWGQNDKVCSAVKKVFNFFQADAKISSSEVVSENSIQKDRERKPLMPFSDFETSIQELRSLQDDKDQAAELARLNAIPEVKVVLDKANVPGGLFGKPRHLIALGHAVEIREKFKDQYYTITHGQNPQLMILNFVSMKLREVITGKGPSPQKFCSIPLRDPCFVKHVKSYQTSDWFRNACDADGVGYGGSGLCGDHNFRNELVCGDGYLGSIAVGESALNFFGGSDNIGHPAIRNILRQQILDCKEEAGLSGTDAPDVEGLLDKLMELFNRIPTNWNGHGNLYVVLVPKEKFKKCGYLSKPYGKSISTMPGGLSEEKVLGKLQKDEECCYYEYGDPVIPQVRLLTHTLTEENGVCILQESTFSDKSIEKFDTKVYGIISSFTAGVSDITVTSVQMD